MSAIDLVQFTNSSKKISPKNLLDPSVFSTKVGSTKILGALMFDTFTIIAGTVLMTNFLLLSMDKFIISRGLHRVFNSIEYSGLTASLLPLIFVSYFFFCYFFNQGQTVGMNKTKCRIEMENMSFKSAFSWAVFSFSVVVSGGFSFVIAKGWEAFRPHDYLYQGLMQTQAQSPINLFDYVKEESSKEEFYQIAA